ncbi:MAG: alkaline phosphatase family protein, partial [Calditrichaeota bacterium]
PEVNRVISRLDSLLGMLINGLRDMHMLEKVNLIVVSDHGMTEVDTFRIVNVEKQLQGFACRYTGDGPVLTIRPEEAQLEAVYARLKKSARHYRVYRREEVPEYYHFSHHPFIDPLVLVAEPGWSLHSNASLARLRRRHPAATGGNHGYDNHFLDMHGIFYAMGPAFKQGYRTGTLRNIDVYPLLCKIFHIMPRQNIDGKLERIAFILREDWLN